MLAKQGHQISIFERFASPRPVGSGIILQPTGLAVLHELGLEDEIHSVGKRIDRIRGVAMPAGKQVLNVDYDALGGGYHGLAVHRAALFDVLYSKVLASDIDIVTGVDISDAVLNSDGAFFSDTRGDLVGAYELLIDASGAGSRLKGHAIHKPRVRKLSYGALWGSFRWPDSGFDQNALEQRYVGAHTMIGVLPIGRPSGSEFDQVAFFWSIKVDDYDNWLSAGLDSWKQRVLSIWPETESILEQISDTSDMALAKYEHSTLRIPHGDRIAFLGDAAHATSPQLGQGANMALLDAWSLASALRRTANVNDALSRYARNRRWHVRAFQLSSLGLTPFYQSDSRFLAALRDLFFDPVSKLPIARRIVAGLVSGMLASPPADLFKDRPKERRRGQ